MSGDARAELLQRIRTAVAPGGDDATRRAAVAARLSHPARGPAVAGSGDRVRRFRDAAIRAGATVETLPDWSAVTEAARRFLSEANLPARLRLAADPRLGALAWPATLQTTVHTGGPADDEGPSLVVARAGVAETGSVVFVATPDHPPSLNLLPESEIVVVEAASICERAEDLWDAWRKRRLPRSLCFVSGPSRTGDIEMNLVTGVHGPRRLHILLIEAPGP